MADYQEFQSPIKTGGDHILKFMQDFMKIPVHPNDQDANFSGLPFETAEEVSSTDSSPSFSAAENDASEQSEPFSSLADTDEAGHSFEDYFSSDSESQGSSDTASTNPFPWMDKEETDSAPKASSADTEQATSSAAEEEEVKEQDENDDNEVLFDLSDEEQNDVSNVPSESQEASLTSVQTTSLSEKQGGSTGASADLPASQDLPEEDRDSLEDDLEEVLLHLEAVSQHLYDLSTSLRRVIQELRNRI